MNLSPLPIQKFFDNDGRPLVGGLLFTYVAGTSTKIATYKDSSGGPTNANPIVLDYRGEANIWLDQTLTYKFVLAPAGDTDPPTRPIWTVDNISAAVTFASLTLQILGQILYPRTAGEIAAGVTPTNYWYPPGWIYRYQLNTVPGTTDMSDAFQKAIDSADTTYPQVFFTGDNAIGKPLLLRTTTTQSISLIGTGRVSTNLLPLASDIKVAAQNINCMIFNQNNNLNLHLRGFRWLTATTPGFTGIFMYAIEGGGADASGQAMFSMVVEDFWGAPQSTNAGVFDGGFSNLVTHTCVYESVKNACWRLRGVGNSDHHHTNITLNLSFDSYIYGSDDTQTKAIIRVDGLHAYNHQRGPLIEMKNGTELTFSDCVVEAATGNFGTIGLFKLTDCTAINIGKSTMSIANATVRGACGVELIGACTGRVDGLLINADVGVRVSGAGTIELTLENIEASGCQYAWQHLSGNLAGSMRIDNCKFNKSEYGLLMSAGSPTYTLDMTGGEIMNAGYPSTSTGRNVNLSFAGSAVNLVGVKIGHDDVLATATHMFNLTGTGVVLLKEPILIGTPPTAFAQGTQTLSYDGVDSSMPGMTAFVPSLGGNTTYSVQSGAWNIKGGRFYFSGEITVTTLGTGSASVISGLPFSAAGGGAAGGGFVHQFSGLNATVTSLGVLPSGTSMTLKGMTAAAAVTSTISGYTNGTDTRFTGNYLL